MGLHRPTDDECEGTVWMSKREMVDELSRYMKACSHARESMASLEPPDDRGVMTMRTLYDLLEGHMYSLVEHMPEGYVAIPKPLIVSYAMRHYVHAAAGAAQWDEPR